MKQLWWRLLSTVCALAATAISLTALASDQNNSRKLPIVYPRNSSLYVTAQDGTKIAIDVWLPEKLDGAQHIPALIKGTPYWRARELTPLGQAQAPTLATESEVAALNARGYAVISVDARGTGASFGTLDIMFSDPEVADYGSVADWITSQPWSNGNVGAYGFSYRGITAANIASLPNPSIKAVAPLFDLSDLYLLIYPGGAFESYLARAWSNQTRLLNGGEMPCAGDQACQKMIRGPKPVASDFGRELLNRAIAAHAGNYNVYNCARAAPARDDDICDSHQSLSNVSVISRQDEIEQRRLPFFVLTGWLDESSPGQALYRYKTFSNPQELIIGPFTHGGFKGDDPLLPDRPLDVSYQQQTDLMADFFDRYLKDRPVRPIISHIRYYVNGAGQWRTSPVWPPAETAVERWYLGSSHALLHSARMAPGGTDDYAVDFSATTGRLSGYRGQVDLSKTDYGNRQSADAHLLTYTSRTFSADMEIAGDPIAHVRLASSATDGLLLVYLEDVAPDGRVTYISHGVLRLAFRQIAKRSDRALSADSLHTYRRADMSSMTPGRFENVVIGISPIAALIRKGHRLRVAIAGADEGNLERLPAKGKAKLSVARGAETYVEVPQMP